MKGGSDPPAYIASLRQGAWGDQLTLAVASHLLHRPVTVITDSANPGSATLKITPPAHISPAAWGPAVYIAHMSEWLRCSGCFMFWGVAFCLSDGMGCACLHYACLFSCSDGDEGTDRATLALMDVAAMQPAPASTGGSPPSTTTTSDSSSSA